MAELRPGQRQRESAGVRRPDLQGPDRSAALRPALGQRLPAEHSSRACSSARARTRCCISTIRTASRGTSRRKMLDRLAELHALQFEDLGDPEINARVAQYEMAYRMQTSVPEVMDISQGAGQASSSCTARRRRSPAPSPRTACSPAAWPSATCGSSSSIIPAGTTTAACPAASAANARTWIRPCYALDHRSQATRAARRHAGRLGRRVRADQLFTRQADRDRLRPRPSPALLHGVDGGRRRQAGHELRRDRRFRLQRRARSRSTSTTSRRPSSTCWASTTRS